HRAVDDAKATSEIFIKSMDILNKNGIKDFNKINKLIEEKDISKGESFHIVIFAKNLTGLKNLYKLIS
ncbi:hypothetical protein, partial [Schnuerera sp.]|uniref:hypothetical protein n=1 Tax=Schnuerera sp. TaxID=2794844 RepID=UPI002CEBC14B